MNIRRTVLNVEELGSRTLPSAALPAVPHVANASDLRDFGHGAPITAGHGFGHYMSGPAHPDVGKRYDLHGVAELVGLGRGTLIGSVISTGFIHNGHASGILTFANNRGTVTLKLTGPEQPGFAPLPGSFHYEIISGTGAFHALHSAGTMDLQLGPPVFATFTVTFRPHA